MIPYEGFGSIIIRIFVRMERQKIDAELLVASAFWVPMSINPRTNDDITKITLTVVIGAREISLIELVTQYIADGGFAPFFIIVDSILHPPIIEPVVDLSSIHFQR